MAKRIRSRRAMRHASHGASNRISAVSAKRRGRSSPPASPGFWRREKRISGTRGKPPQSARLLWISRARLRNPASPAIGKSASGRRVKSLRNGVRPPSGSARPIGVPRNGSMTGNPIRRRTRISTNPIPPRCSARNLFWRNPPSAPACISPGWASAWPA